MNSLADFQNEYMNMCKNPPADAGMVYSHTPFVSRYIGEGKESYWYSLSLIKDCENYEDLKTIILAEVKTAEDKGVNYQWKTYDFPKAPHLATILEDLKFRIDRTSRLMFADVNHEIPSLINTDVEVVRVTHTDQIKIIDDIGKDVWGAENFSEWVSEVLREEIKTKSPLTRAFLAKVQNNWATCGWIKYYGKIGMLLGGSSIAKYRGQGAYRAVVEARRQAAKADGLKYIVSECSPASEKVLRSLGFQDAGIVKVYEVTKK